MDTLTECIKSAHNCFGQFMLNNNTVRTFVPFHHDRFLVSLSSFFRGRRSSKSLPDERVEVREFVADKVIEEFQCSIARLLRA